MTGGAKPTVEEAVERLWLKVLYDDREIERPSPNTIVSAKDIRTLLADRTALVSRIKELEGALSAMRQRSVQALGAGISRRDWHATEAAYNEVRDRTDELLRAAARVITEEGK